MDNVLVSENDGDGMRTSKPSRRSPQLTPSRLFVNHLESIKKDKEKEDKLTRKLAVSIKEDSTSLQPLRGTPNQKIHIKLHTKSLPGMEEGPVCNKKGSCRGEEDINDNTIVKNESSACDISPKAAWETKSSKQYIDHGCLSRERENKAVDHVLVNKQTSKKSLKGRWPQFKSSHKSEKRQNSVLSHAKRTKTSDSKDDKKCVVLGEWLPSMSLSKQKKSKHQSSPTISDSDPLSTTSDASNDVVYNRCASLSLPGNQPSVLTRNNPLEFYQTEHLNPMQLLNKTMCQQNDSPHVPSSEEEGKSHPKMYGYSPTYNVSYGSSVLSCGSDVYHPSQPIGNAVSYFACIPSMSQARSPHDDSSRWASLTPFSSINEDKKYQRLQTLHNPPKPNYHGFQLIGDSMLLRFSHQILGETHLVAESLRFLGYCVSGQRIGELLKRLKSGFYHIGKKVILMIGTNDLLRRTRVEQMCSELHSIINFLKHYTDNVVVLTLPPVPLLKDNTDHWRRLEEYNTFIKKLSITNPGVSVSDLFPNYVCTEEEAEERETISKYYSNSLFCYGCFTCDSLWDDLSYKESEDFEEMVDSTSSVHAVTFSNSFVSINDMAPYFMDRRISKCRMECFELFFSDSTRKDLIHLNKKGLQIIEEHLRKHLP